MGDKSGRGLYIRICLTGIYLTMFGLLTSAEMDMLVDPEMNKFHSIAASIRNAQTIGQREITLSVVVPVKVVTTFRAGPLSYTVTDEPAAAGKRRITKIAW